MNRGKVNNIGEYYHLKGILDGGPELLNEEELSKLSLMIEEYEKKVAK